MNNIVRELVTRLKFVYDHSGLLQFQNGVNQAKGKLNEFVKNTQKTTAFSGMKTALEGVRAKIRGVMSDWRKVEKSTDQKLASLAFADKAKLARYQKAITDSQSIYKKHSVYRHFKPSAKQSVKGKEVGADSEGDDVVGGLLSVKNLAAGYFATLAGGSIIGIADEWASVSGRIKLATKDAEEHKKVMSEVYNISQRTGQAMSATGDLFQKVARNQKDLNLTTDDTLKLTEIIGQTLTIGGGDETANSASLLQLGQALAAGKLSGDELNSVIEQTPRLAEAIAKSFGVGVGQLKEMGKEGKLTAKELTQGLLKQADAIQKEFEQMPATFSFGMTKMKNAMGRFINLAVNDVLQLGKWFTKMAEWIEQNINLVLILAVSAIGGKLMLALKATNGVLKSITVQVWKAIAPLLPWLALFTAIGLIAEDIYYWINGGGSLIGALVGDFDQWRGQFVEIGKSAKMLWLNLKGLFNDVLKFVGADFQLDFASWQEAATKSLQVLIDQTKGLVQFFRGIVKSIRALINGNFSAAFDDAGEAMGQFNLLAGVLLYKPLWKFTKLLWFVAKTGWKAWGLFGKMFGWFDMKSGQALFSLWGKARRVLSKIGSQAIVFGKLLAKYIPIALRFIGNGFMWLGRIMAGFVAAAVKGILAIARAMFAAMAANPILAAIAVIIAALVAIYVYWDDIKAYAAKAWEWISQKAGEFGEWIATVFNDACAAIETAWNTFWENTKAYAEQTWKALTDSIENTWKGITDTFSNLWSNAVDKVTAFLSNMIPQGVKDFLGSLGNFFSSSGSKTIDVNVSGGIGALQQPTGSRYSQNQVTINNTVNGVTSPQATGRVLNNTAMGLSGFALRNAEAMG